MSRLLSKMLLLHMFSLPCLAFLPDMNSGRSFLQPPETACYDFRSRLYNQSTQQQHRPKKAANPRGTGFRRIASRKTISTPPSTTLLSLHPTTGASLAIAGSSLFGMQVSRIFPSGGILGTLVSAAFFGNVCTKWVPNAHPLYDLCFTLFLPGSLTLLLLAYRPPISLNHSIDEQSQEKPKANPQNSISACIRRVAMPFLITSLASLAGCWLSYWSSVNFGWFQNAVTTSASSSTVAGMDKARELARITTGCMSASYVGGSVNFISTARIVGAPADLLGSLVTADLFTMAIYFSFLSSSLDWEWLVSKFASKKTTEQNSVDAKTKASGSLQNKDKIDSTNQDDSMSSLKAFSLTSIPLLMSTFYIVQVANRVETLLGRFVPGSACAFIALVAPLLNSLVQAKDFWNPVSKAATIWSDFFFLSFFASIGVAANLSSALSMGPTCLLFSTIALIAHVLGTVSGCLLWKKVLTMISRRRDGDNIPSLDLEDVWIASNAAIGGPATAAAFCGRMKKRDPGKLQGRTISATVWGVVGYAIGTIVGVSMYRMV